MALDLNVLKATIKLYKSCFRGRVLRNIHYVPTYDYGDGFQGMYPVESDTYTGSGSIVFVGYAQSLLQLSNDAHILQINCDPWLQAGSKEVVIKDGSLPAEIAGVFVGGEFMSQHPFYFMGVTMELHQPTTINLS